MQHWRAQLQVPHCSDTVVFQRVAGVLGPVLEYLGSSCTPTAMAVRAWCLLYCMRPDLIEYESLVSASKRFGVSHQVINRILRDFEDAVPGFHFVRREPDNAGISRKLTSKTVEGRHAIQRRAALKKQGATFDLSADEMEREQREIAPSLLNRESKPANMPDRLSTFLNRQRDDAA